MDTNVVADEGKKLVYPFGFTQLVIEELRRLIYESGNRDLNSWVNKKIDAIKINCRKFCDIYESRESTGFSLGVETKLIELIGENLFTNRTANHLIQEPDSAKPVKDINLNDLRMLIRGPDIGAVSKIEIITAIACCRIAQEVKPTSEQISNTVISEIDCAINGPVVSPQIAATIDPRIINYVSALVEKNPRLKTENVIKALSSIVDIPFITLKMLNDHGLFSTRTSNVLLYEADPNQDSHRENSPVIAKDIAELGAVEYSDILRCPNMGKPGITEIKFIVGIVQTLRAEFSPRSPNESPVTLRAIGLAARLLETLALNPESAPIIEAGLAETLKKVSPHTTPEKQPQ